MKILLVTRGVFTNVLGTPKVHWDLKEEYEKKGHQVEVLDYSVVYPNGQSKFSQIFGRLYTYEYLDYLKRNAHKYDVIDTNYEAITFPKSSYNFKGLVMGRSHGLPPIYKAAEECGRYADVIEEERSQFGLKTKLGNVYRSFLKGPTMKEFMESVQSADIFHCLSRAEVSYFRSLGIAQNKIKLIANGLPDKDIHNLNNSDVAFKNNTLAFIGSWTLRKGIKDMNYIVNGVTKAIPLDKVSILGGHYNEEVVKQDFEPVLHHLLEVVPQFKPEMLPVLLQKVKVGIFPSYIEGFGLAVVEQLACGIPVVAFDVPGPSDILQEVDPSLLIELDNLPAFVRKVVSILQMSEHEYRLLSEKCKRASQKYLLSKIADQFLNVYSEELDKIKSN